MKVFCSKIITLLVFIRYPRISGQYRWFLRFSFIGRMVQVRHLYRDYVVRKPYKEIKFFGEFQQELLYVIPFAYWHHRNGTLKKTISSAQTKPFYFFSKDHNEYYNTRKWLGNFNINIPNGPHNISLNRVKWTQVPYKEFYKNEEYQFDKPILVIANRYNTEWGQEPISYFDIEIMEKMILLLKEKYQLVYNRPGQQHIVHDNSEVMELNDIEWIKSSHPEVVIMQELFERDRESVANYNELQLKVYANSSRFISIHGGTATLASYFGGRNIIYSRRGHEHYLKEFDRIFPYLSNAEICHVTDYDKLIKFVKTFYVEQ